MSLNVLEQGCENSLPMNEVPRNSSFITFYEYLVEKNKVMNLLESQEFQGCW